MSKGIVNNRDKFIWDNAHKPTIDDAVAAVDDEMDDLLDDHDDKVVDIVGDNMNDLLDAHDDKVVSIVGDNMGTLLTSAASTVKTLAQIALSTDTPYKIGTFGTASVYVKAFSGTVTADTWVNVGTIPATAQTLGFLGAASAGDRIYNIGVGQYPDASTDIRVESTGSIRVYTKINTAVTSCIGIIIYSIEEE